MRWGQHHRARRSLLSGLGGIGLEPLDRCLGPLIAGDASCGSRAFDKHKDFAVSYVILCEKLRISFRMDPYRGVWVTCLDRSNGLTFVRNGNKRPFLQWRCATAVR